MLLKYTNKSTYTMSSTCKYISSYTGWSKSLCAPDFVL